jgi:hypothetical protein
LTSLCCKENIQQILKELQIYVKDNNQKFVCTTIRAIGRVADAAVDGDADLDSGSIADSCMEGIMHLLICNR